MSLTDQKRGVLASKREKVFRCFVFLSCVCLMMQIFSIPYKIYIVTSLSNKLLLFAWLLLGFYVLVTQLLERATLPFVCLLFIVVMAFLSFGVTVVFQPALISSLGSVLGFFMLPLMLYCIKSWGISHQVKKIVLACNLAMSFQYILLYHSSLRHSYDGIYGVVQIPSVTLGFPNPNQTATMLFVCIILLFVSFFFFENKRLKALILIDFFYVSYIMYETDSRTALLLYVVFLFFAWVSLKKYLPDVMTDFCLLAPVVYMIMAVLFISLFGAIEFLGENIFTGREHIFAKYFDNLNIVNFFLGDFSTFRFENLHNGYVSIAATMGIIVLIAYYVFLRHMLTDAKKKTACKYELVAFCGLLCLVTYTCTESGFFVGGAMYAYMIAMVFLMMPTEAPRESLSAHDHESKEAVNQ